MDLKSLYKLSWGGKGVRGNEWEALLRDDFEPRRERMQRDAADTPGGSPRQRCMAIFGRPPMVMTPFSWGSRGRRSGASASRARRGTNSSASLITFASAPTATSSHCRSPRSARPLHSTSTSYRRAETTLKRSLLTAWRCRRRRDGRICPPHDQARARARGESRDAVTHGDIQPAQISKRTSPFSHCCPMLRPTSGWCCRRDTSSFPSRTRPPRSSSTIPMRCTSTRGRGRTLFRRGLLRLVRPPQNHCA